MNNNDEEYTTGASVARKIYILEMLCPEKIPSKKRHQFFKE